MAKKEKSTLVKIDKDLYDALKILVEENHLEYPTIKNFIERAIMAQAGYKKYDIQGINDPLMESKPLKKVVGIPKSNFSQCLVCNRFFLRDKDETGEKSRICPNCKETITHFSDIINKTDGGNKKS